MNFGTQATHNEECGLGEGLFLPLRPLLEDEPQQGALASHQLCCF